MGLDVSLYKVIKHVDDKHEHYFNLEGSPELNQFKSLAYERVNEYYDLEGAIKNLGHNPDEIEEIGFDIETDELISNCYGLSLICDVHLIFKTIE